MERSHHTHKPHKTTHIAKEYESESTRDIMTDSAFYLPGDIIPPPQRNDKQQALKLAPGLRLLSTQTHTKQQQQQQQHKGGTALTPAIAGLLTADRKRTTTNLTLHTFTHHHYRPSPHDLVIAQIHHGSADFYHCALARHAPHVALPQLAFEGATKKTRPMLRPGDCVYARVVSVGVVAGGGEVEISCVDPATGKAGAEGLGPLAGGMVFDVSVGLAARLLVRSVRRSGVVVLEELGRKVEGYGGFEVVVGKNGRVWVNCSGKEGEAGEGIGMRIVILVGRCLEAVDEGNLDVQQQKKLVSRLLREMGLAS